MTHSLTRYLTLSPRSSLTCSPTPFLTRSDTCSLTRSHFQSDHDALWRILCDTLSRTHSLWQTLSDNMWKQAWVVHHQSVVNISAYIRLPLESIWVTGAYKSWSLDRWCSRIYRSAAMGFQYQNSVAFPSRFIELAAHPHPSPSISSMSAMCWKSLSGLFTLASGTISLCSGMMLSFVLPRLGSITARQSCHRWGVANEARGSQSSSSNNWTGTVSSIGGPGLGNISVSGRWFYVPLSIWIMSSASSWSSASDTEWILK